MGVKIQPKRGTAAQAAAANDILSAGEVGYETDTKRKKTGDGATAWNSLPYDPTPTDLAAKADAAATTTALAAKAAASDLTTLGSTVAAKANAGVGLALQPRRRGMSTDDLVQVAQNTNAQYWPLFGRYGPNLNRRFMRPYAPSLGAPYTPGNNSNAALGISEATWFGNLLIDINAAVAVGAQTCITFASQRAGNANERNDIAWWGSTSAKQELINQWVRLATFLKGNADVWAFDLINEAWARNGTDDISFAAQQRLNDWQLACAQAIRAVDPSRTIIVSVGIEGPAKGYPWMLPIDLDNIIYSVHMYQPFALSHANVAGIAPAYTDVYPSVAAVNGGDGKWESTRANKTRILRELEPVIAFQKRYGVQIFVGEFGAFTGNPVNVSADYLEDCISVFESLGWHWNLHAFGFLPVQFATMVQPYDTGNIYTNAGQSPLNTLTGATNQARPTGTAAFAAFYDKNVPWKQPGRPTPAISYMQDFDITPTTTVYGDWTNPSHILKDAGFTINFAATDNPPPGSTKFCTITQGSSIGAGALQVPSQDAHRDMFVSFYMRLNVAPTNSFLIAHSDSYNGTSPSGWSILYDPTLGWVLQLNQGTVTLGLPHFDMPIGAWKRIKIHIKAGITSINSDTDGRARVWMDGRQLIEWSGQTTNRSDDSVNFATVGLAYSNQNFISGSQAAMSVSIDQLRYSRGEGNCDLA